MQYTHRRFGVAWVCAWTTGWVLSSLVDTFLSLFLRFWIWTDGASGLLDFSGPAGFAVNSLISAMPVMVTWVLFIGGAQAIALRGSPLPQLGWIKSTYAGGGIGVALGIFWISIGWVIGFQVLESKGPFFEQEGGWYALIISDIIRVTVNPFPIFGVAIAQGRLLRRLGLPAQRWIWVCGGACLLVAVIVPSAGVGAFVLNPLTQLTLGFRLENIEGGFLTSAILYGMTYVPIAVGGALVGLATWQILQSYLRRLQVSTS